MSAFLTEIEKAGLELHGLMIYRHGQVAVEGSWWPHRLDQRRVFHSVAKSFTSCAVGIALKEDRFKLSDKVISFFPDELPDVVSGNLALMTVHDLLTMRSGHSVETSGSEWRGVHTSWVREFFSIPVVHAPGSKFVYSSAASYMLSAIITVTTGESMHDYLRPRVLEPIGITGETWEVGPDGYNPGGNGLSCTSEDLLRFGILHLNKGTWDGHQLVPPEWIAEASKPQGDNTYGFHWVINWGSAYSALGLFVQCLMIFPEHDAAMVLTGAMNDSSDINPKLEEYFPAVFLPDPIANPHADMKLKEMLKKAALEPRAAGSVSPLSAKISGRRFVVTSNPQGVREVLFDFHKDYCIFHQIDSSGEHTVVCGISHWHRLSTDIPGRKLHHGYELANAPVVANAKWIDANTLEMTWIFVETAFRDKVTCRFEGDNVTIDRSVNVNSGSKVLPQISGTLVSQVEVR